jgi:ppGpp synthetase/RelA/SpoT-type nucleotidyltranferase
MSDKNMNDDYKALLISSNGDKAVSNVVDFLRRAEVTEGCYAYKFRVKSHDDLKEKKARKLPEKPAYQIEHITDVIGIRLVTLFKGDMLKVYANLISMLAEPPDKPQIHCAQPEEVIVYKGTSALEDFAEEIRRLTIARFEKAIVQSKNSLEEYSSIHVICRYVDHLADVTGTDEPYRLPIEIQIRTVFEDAWGEIDHKYGYVLREGKKAGDPVHNASQIKAHLKVLKQFSDACMNYAECIRLGALPEMLDLTGGVTRAISVESDEGVLQRFEALGLGLDFIQKYSEARVLRDKARDESGSTSDGRITAERSYLAAAEQFAGLLVEIVQGRDIDTLGNGEKLACYYSSMNEAFSLMSTNNPEFVNLAVEKYRHIEGHFQEYPLVKMRLGQALAKIGQVEESIQKLEEAGKDFQGLGEQAKKTGTWQDTLPKVDFDHMRYTQPKLLGYSLWKKSQLGTLSRQEKSELNYSAYIVTRDCLEIKDLDRKKRVDALNNVLYYSVGFVFYADEEGARLAEVKEQVPRLLKEMLTECGGIDRLPIEDLDTVFRAYAILKDERAKGIAGTLIQRCLRREAGLVSSLRMSIAEVAQEYLDKGTIVAM